MNVWERLVIRCVAAYLSARCGMVYTKEHDGLDSERGNGRKKTRRDNFELNMADKDP